MLTRDPSSATDEEKDVLTSMAADANLVVGGGQPTQPIVSAVLKAYMPLWEAIVESAAALSWLGDGARGPLPCTRSVAAALQDHGHAFPPFVDGLSLATKIGVLVRIINEISTRVAPSWPLASSVCAAVACDPSVGRHGDHACALAIVDIGVRYAFIAFMPCVDPSGLTTMVIHRVVPPTTMATASGSDSIHRGELLEAAVARSGGHPICADPKRIGAAFSPDRFRALFALLGDALVRNRPLAMGIRTTTCHRLGSILADFCQTHGSAAGSRIGCLFLLERRAPAYVMWTTLGDLVEMLDCLSDNQPVNAPTSPSLFNAAAKAVARTLPQLFDEDVLAALDHKSLARVAAHVFDTTNPANMDDDALARVASVLGASDDNAPLGSRQHRERLCRAITLAVAREHGLCRERMVLRT